MTGASPRAAFEAAHKSRFGFIDASKQLVVEAVSVEAVGGGAKFREKKLKTSAKKLPSPAKRTQFFSGGQWHKAAVYTRDQLAPGHKVMGPAIVIEPHQTVVVEAGWDGELTAAGDLLLRRPEPPARPRLSTAADPVGIELFNALFTALAPEIIVVPIPIRVL